MISKRSILGIFIIISSCAKSTLCSSVNVLGIFPIPFNELLFGQFYASVFGFLIIACLAKPIELFNFTDRRRAILPTHKQSFRFIESAVLIVLALLPIFKAILSNIAIIFLGSIAFYPVSILKRLFEFFQLTCFFTSGSSYLVQILDFIVNLLEDVTILCGQSLHKIGIRKQIITNKIRNQLSFHIGIEILVPFCHILKSAIILTLSFGIVENSILQGIV